MQNHSLGIALLVIGFLWIVFGDHQKRMQREATKYGSRQKTMVVSIVTLCFWLTWLYMINVSRSLFYGMFAYLLICGFINSSLGIPSKDELKDLDWGDRLWLRSFYAFTWPFFAFKALRIRGLLTKSTVCTQPPL